MTIICHYLCLFAFSFSRHVESFFRNGRNGIDWKSTTKDGLCSEQWLCTNYSSVSRRDPTCRIVEQCKDLCRWPQSSRRSGRLFNLKSSSRKWGDSNCNRGFRYDFIYKDYGIPYWNIPSTRRCRLSCGSSQAFAVWMDPIGRNSSSLQYG
jgi:hypothetical protein